MARKRKPKFNRYNFSSLVKCENCILWKTSCTDTEADFACEEFHSKIEVTRSCGSCTLFNTKKCSEYKNIQKETSKIEAHSTACLDYKTTKPYFDDYKHYSLKSDLFDLFLREPRTSLKINMHSDYYPLLYGFLPVVDYVDNMDRTLSKKDLKDQSFLFIFGLHWVFMDPNLNKILIKTSTLKKVPWEEYDSRGLLFIKAYTSERLTNVFINPLKAHLELAQATEIVDYLQENL